MLAHSYVVYRADHPESFHLQFLQNPEVGEPVVLELELAQVGGGESDERLDAGDVAVTWVDVSLLRWMMLSSMKLMLTSVLRSFSWQSLTKYREAYRSRACRRRRSAGG